MTVNDIKTTDDFFEFLKSSQKKWDFGDIGRDHFNEQCPDEVDLRRFAKWLLLSQAKKPTPKLLVFLAKKQLSGKETPACGKCQRGYITIFNDKIWWPKSEYENGFVYSWQLENITNILLIPKADVACSCKSGDSNIKNYLKWLAPFSYKSAAAYQIAFIQLWLFYSCNLEGTLELRDFNPYNFWNTPVDVDPLPLMTVDDITEPHIRKAFLEHVQPGRIQKRKTPAKIVDNVTAEVKIEKKIYPEEKEVNFEEEKILY